MRTWNALMIVMVALALSTTPGWTETTREKLSNAEDNFLEANFAAALEGVDRLLESGDLRGDALRDAWVLRARCELALGHRASAEDSFCAGIRLDRNWEPDPELFTRNEVASFERSRRDCLPDVDRAAYLPRPESAGAPWYRKKTVLGLLGAAAVTATVIALSGGDDEEVLADLSFFPEPPAR